MSGGNNSEFVANYSRKSISYPSPFFDIGQKYIPRSVKEVFRWTKYHYISSSVIYPIVNKMCEYPMTGLTYSVESETWKKTLEDVLDIRSFLISVHQSVFVFGNAFILMNYPFIRYLITPSGKRYKAAEIDYKIKFENKKWFLYGRDPDTKLECQFKVQDIFVANKNMVKLVHIDPLNIDIDYNSLTGDAYYKYTLPADDKRKINANVKVYLDSTPQIIFDSMAHNKAILMDENHFFHFKRPTIAGLWPGWGTPALVPVLKDIHYFSVLRKANEALALQRIVPLMILFPNANADVTPFKSLNLSDWKRRVEEELMKWRRDPNYIPVMPVPVGQELLGGDAKGLMVTQEMEFVARGIAAALGVPLEFIQGGLNWSGSSISLRILENTFIKQREEDLSFLNNFLIPRLSKYFKLPKISIGFKSFKMADDIQFQQLMFNAMQGGFISRKRFLDQFDVPHREEYEQMKKEHAELSSIQRDDLIQQTEVQALANSINARSQAMAQIEAQKIQEEYKEKTNPAIDTQVSTQDIAHKYAAQIMTMPPESAQEILGRMQQEMPTMFELVQEAMKEMQAQAAQPEEQPQQQVAQPTQAPIGGKVGHAPQPAQKSVNMKPLPTTKPPNRKGGSPV